MTTERCWMGEAVLAFVALLASGLACAQAAEPVASQPEAVVRRGDTPIILTSSRLDLNSDGKLDSVRIELVEGRRYEDIERWCGAGPKVEGQFRLVTELSGRAPVAGDLNALLDAYWNPFPGAGRNKPAPDIWFADSPWELEIEDLNGDYQPDLSVGQYGGCNGNRFALFTVEPDGRVSPLAVQGGWGPSCSCREYSISFATDTPGHIRWQWRPEEEADPGFADACWDAARRAFVDVVPSTGEVCNHSTVPVCRVLGQGSGADDRWRLISQPGGRISADSCREFDIGLKPLMVKALACDGTVLEQVRANPKEGPTIDIGKPGCVTIIVDNHATRDICAVRTQGPPLLREGDRIAPGERRAVFVFWTGASRFEALDCAGEIIQANDGFEVSDRVKWVVRDPAK